MCQYLEIFEKVSTGIMSLQWCSNGSEGKTPILLDRCPFLSRFMSFGVEHAIAHENDEGDNGTNRDYRKLVAEIYEDCSRMFQLTWQESKSSNASRKPIQIYQLS